MNRVHVGLAVGGTVIALLLLMPSERLDGLKEIGQRMVASKYVACLDYERKTLKDPDSARLLGYSRDASDVDLVHVTYKAKNGFGAYDTFKADCKVGVDGIDEDGTALYRRGRQLEAEGAALQHRSECLQRELDLMNNGTPSADAARQVRASDPTCSVR